MLSIISYMPDLKHVEMGYNRLQSLSSDGCQRPTQCSLELVNLDNNRLEDWTEIVAALKSMYK